MIKDPVIRKGIIASIVATLIVMVLIHPLLRLCWEGVLGFGTYCHRGFVDSIYRSAALGKRNHVAVMLMGLIFCFLVGGITGVAVGLTRRIVKPKAERKPPGKTHAVVAWIMVVAIALSWTVLLVRQFADLQLNTSFDQRLTVLAPKLTELECKELRAQWASMGSRGDYEEIVSTMETLAEEKDVALPELLLK